LFKTIGVEVEEVDVDDDDVLEVVVVVLILLTFCLPNPQQERQDLTFDSFARIFSGIRQVSETRGGCLVNAINVSRVIKRAMTTSTV
jgi:hypothetical protein